MNEIVQPQNILQTLVYHSSCSQNLFLKDRFGSVQLVVFVNEDQGTVTCFQNATLTFDIDVPVDIEGGSAELTALNVISNVGIFDLSDQVAGVIVTPEMPFQATATITMDLTVRQKYTALSTIIGRTDEGKGCFGTDFFEFEAGNPLPPIFPTLAPSAAPTISPFPTPDPETAPCNLRADIECQRSGGGSCRRWLFFSFVFNFDARPRFWFSLGPLLFGMAVLIRTTTAAFVVVFLFFFFFLSWLCRQEDSSSPRLNGIANIRFVSKIQTSSFPLSSILGTL